MKVHFFYSNKSCHSWYSVDMVALLEEDVYSRINQRHEKSFRYIEEIRCHIHKDLSRFHVSSFRIDFGKESCHGAGCTSVKQLMKEMVTDKRFYDYRVVNEKDYKRLRQRVLAIYNRTPQMDFSLVAGEQTHGITVLF